jgi:dTDP-4-dehydrorhamnose reductase
MNKTILILGAGGMLGHMLCHVMATKPSYTVFAALRAPITPSIFPDNVKTLYGIDVLNDTALTQLFTQVQPDIVINAIGIVKQLNAAHDRYLSVAINAFLPHRLSKLCQSYNARLIHISTDCVFNGEKGMYVESDLSDAEDLYGKSKFLGETDETEINAITLRTSIIGHEIKSHTHGLLEWMLQQNGKPIKGFTRAFFSGFTTNELANVIILLIDQHPKLHGLYHVASERISKYDLLGLIREIYNLNIDITPDANLQCDRSLSMQRFIEATGYHAPTWPSMIQAMHDKRAN